MKKILKLHFILVLFFFSLFVISSCSESTPPVKDEHTIHMDDDNDGICDICKEVLKKECTIHMDDDNDGICDVCGNKLTSNVEQLSGTYVLQAKTVSLIDQMDAVLLDVLTFNENSVNHEVIDYSGVKNETGTYTLKGEELVLKYGIYEYKYTYNKSTNELSFNGTLNKKKTQMTYKLNSSYSKDTSKGNVNFTDELFGPSLNENFYNYCPTIMMEDASTMHIWYCSNDKSGNVTDYIKYRKGKLSYDGKWTFSEECIALEPSESDWDSRHTCDPSVIKGDYTYNGKKYSYLMAYLGCYTSDCTINEVGLAVSENPQGPYIKIGNKPFCDYENSTEFGSDGNKFWGYGQPSLVSVDKKGTAMLFYTKGIKLGTFTYMEEWDFSDLNNPKKLAETRLTDGGEIGVFNNADFAYDPVENRIYCVKDEHSLPLTNDTDWIPAGVSVFYVSGLTNDKSNADCLLRNHTWAKVGTIYKSVTGFDRNHNAGIMTDEYGWIMNYEKIPVVYSVSDLMAKYPNWSLRGQWPALHTYRLHGYIFEN